MVYEKGKLYDLLIKDLKITNENIDYKKPPPEVTYEMLKKSMGNSRDFNLKLKEIEKKPENMVAEALWPAYAKTMFPPNKFGLYVEKKGLKHMNFAMEIKNIEINRPILKEQVTIKFPTRSRVQRFTVRKPINVGGQNINKLNKKNHTLKKQKGGIKYEIDYGRKSLMGINYPDPDALKLYNTPGTVLYSMQIPDNNDRLLLLQLFVYMMYKLKIKTIIDLHSCGTGLHPSGNYSGYEGCYELKAAEEPNKELYINSERETWEFVKKFDKSNINNDNIQFWDDREGVGIEDFTAGTLNGWFKLSDYKHRIDAVINGKKNKNKLVIHCQSGYGRSGIVSLFYLLRDIHYNEYDIKEKWLGLGSSLDMYNYLESKLKNEFQQGEVFSDCSALFTQRLFISRINYIILAINNFNQDTEPFYLYLIPEKELPDLTHFPKDIDWEESQRLLRENTRKEIFIPVLFNYEKIIIEGQLYTDDIETYMRRNNFLLGEHERKDDDELSKY